MSILHENELTGSSRLGVNYSPLVSAKVLGGTQNMNKSRMVHAFSVKQSRKMKRDYLLTLLFAAIVPFFFACSNEDNPVTPDNPSNEDANDGQTSLLVVKSPDNYWDCLYFEGENKYACLKEMDDQTFSMLGNFDNTNILMILDSEKRPIGIEADGFKATITYRGNKAFAFCIAGETMYCDSLTLSGESESVARTRSVSAKGVLNYFKTWITSSGLRYVVNYGADLLAPGISSLIDYLRATDDMTPDEVLNYQINMYDNWDTYLAEYLSGKLIPGGLSIPQDWWQKAKDELKEYVEENKKNEKVLSTIIVGLVTGNAPYIYSESAKCLVDGYLQAIANDGSFNFDYGICYSENANPTINDNVASKNIQSGSLISSITLTLPEPFLLTNLKKNTKYYYRAYFKDNTNNIIDYSNIIREFTTSDIPASISSFAQTNSYHNQNGYTNNGKTYSYKFMTTLKAELESFDDIMDWGYYYINEEGNRIAYSMMSRGALRCDDILEYYSRDPETTIKLGCYVKYASIGDKAFYSDPQSYSLKYNDDVTLTFTDCNYIEVTHDNSLGYYRCGVTFDVSFKVQGSQNLTSIVILPYGNFLSWNAPSYNNPSDGDYKTVITDQYLYEYGLYGNFYCYLYAKDVDGKEYYSDNMVRLYHDGYHFTSCVVESWETLSQKAAVRRNALKTISIPKH